MFGCITLRFFETEIYCTGKSTFTIEVFLTLVGNECFPEAFGENDESLETLGRSFSI